MSLPPGYSDVSRDRSNPVPSAVADRWDELLDDAHATATEYREEDWEPLVIHTGDVTVLDGERYGLDVVAPGDEFEELEALTERVEFDSSTVYRTEEGAVRFLLIVVEAAPAEAAVIIPAYLRIDETPILRQRVDEDDVMWTHVRPLSDDVQVSISHEDPELFF